MNAGVTTKSDFTTPAPRRSQALTVTVVSLFPAIGFYRTIHCGFFRLSGTARDALSGMRMQ
jgi:hypothetical protein